MQCAVAAPGSKPNRGLKPSEHDEMIALFDDPMTLHTRISFPGPGRPKGCLGEFGWREQTEIKRLIGRLKVTKPLRTSPLIGRLERMFARLSTTGDARASSPVRSTGRSGVAECRVELCAARMGLVDSESRRRPQA